MLAETPKPEIGVTLEVLFQRRDDGLRGAPHRFVQLGHGPHNSQARVVFISHFAEIFKEEAFDLLFGQAMVVGEVAEVEDLIKKHPEIKAEIQAIETALEEYAFENAVEAPEGLKDKIWEKIKEEEKAIKYGNNDSRIPKINILFHLFFLVS